MADVVPVSSYVIPQITSGRTPSESRQALLGASSDGLQYASQPVSRVGPRARSPLRVLASFVVYGVAYWLLWRTTRQATSVTSRGHVRRKRDQCMRKEPIPSTNRKRCKRL